LLAVDNAGGGVADDDELVGIPLAGLVEEGRLSVRAARARHHTAHAGEAAQVVAGTHVQLVSHARPRRALGGGADEEAAVVLALDHRKAPLGDHLEVAEHVVRPHPAVAPALILEQAVFDGPIALVHLRPTVHAPAVEQSNPSLRRALSEARSRARA